MSAAAYIATGLGLALGVAVVATLGEIRDALRRIAYALEVRNGEGNVRRMFPGEQ